MSDSPITASLPSRTIRGTSTPPARAVRGLARYSIIVWLLQLVVPSLGLLAALRRLREPSSTGHVVLLIVAVGVLWFGACFLVVALPAGRRWIGGHAAQLTGLYLSIGLSLGAAELVCRVFDFTDESGLPGAASMKYSPILGWVPKSGVDGVGPDGWRGPPVPRRKSDGHCRIVCVGDSTTFGYLCTWEEAWPHQLEIALNQDADWIEKNGITEVLNLGVSGYGPDQSLLALKEFGLGYSPDIVIFHLCLNDFADAVYDRNISPAGFTRFKPFYVLKEGRLVPGRDRVPVPRDPAGNVYDPDDAARSSRTGGALPSALWRFVRKQAQALVSGAWRADPLVVSQPQIWPIHDGTRARYAKVRPLVWAMIGEMSRAAREAGAMFLVTLSPANMRFARYAEDNPPWRLATFLREYEDDAKAAGIQALDPVPEFFAADGNELFLLPQDQYHLNAQGNAFIARTITQWLVRE